MRHYNTEKKKYIRLVISANGYDYYIGVDGNGKTFYNLVPEGQPKPAGGYYSSEYICGIKNVPNHFTSY